MYVNEDFVKHNKIIHNSDYLRGVEFVSTYKVSVNTIHQALDVKHGSIDIEEYTKQLHLNALDELIYSGVRKHLQNSLSSFIYELNKFKRDYPHAGFDSEYVIPAWAISDFYEKLLNIIRGLEECPNTPTNVEIVKT